MHVNVYLSQVFRCVCMCVLRCSTLKHLSVRYCDNLTDAALEWLSSSSIISLDISGCNVQDQV